MKLKISKRHYTTISIGSIILLIAGVIGRLVLGDFALVILLIISTILVMYLLLEIYERLSEEHRSQDSQRTNDYRQVEALSSLLSVVKPSLPLPAMRVWAASPDLLTTIAEEILTKKPTLVVEASSGVSTLVIAYCLKQLGQGKVVSLEHDARYAAKSQSLIKRHNLEHIATILYAPLKEVEIDGQQWFWYNMDCLVDRIEQPIDFLVVDGPPSDIHKLSRYPALKLLYRHLRSRSTIFLDDARREDEQEIVGLWEKEFSDISSEFLDTEKGTYLIQRNTPMEETPNCRSQSVHQG